MLQTDERKIGASGITVPALGVGIWSWGDKGTWGYGKDYNSQDISEAYQTCLDAGLNFFDTAEIYGGGESERLLGQCHKDDTRPITIATKFAPLPNYLSGRVLLKHLDESLARLGVDHVDLYQIHFKPAFAKMENFLDAMIEAHQQGKIRAIGVSNFTAQTLHKSHAYLAKHNVPLASNQVHYNLLYRNPERNGVLAACQELNISLIAYSPLEQGILTGKFRAGKTEVPRMRRVMAKINNTDIMGGSKGSGPFLKRLFEKPHSLETEKLEPLFKVLEEIADAHEKTIGQVSLNWLLAKDECIIPIPGAKNARQAKENAGAVGWQLSEEEFERIDLAEKGTH